MSSRTPVGGFKPQTQSPIIPSAELPQCAVLAPEVVIEHFLQQIVDQVSSERPIGRYSITATEGPPLRLNLCHQYVHDSGIYNFAYEITFCEKPQLIAPIPQPNVVSKMQVPYPPWSEQVTEHLKDMWRFAVCPDPLLNRRFTATTFEADDFQIKAVQATCAALKLDHHAFLLLGTGAGKTEIFWMSVIKLLDEEIARREQLGLPRPQVIFLVNNSFILREAEEKLLKRCTDPETKKPRLSTSKVFGGSVDIEGDVVFATPDGLIGDGRLIKMLESGRLFLIGVDEVHHIVADTFATVMTTITNYENSTAQSEQPVTVYKIGMTATEKREDLKDPLQYFENKITVEVPMATLTARGFSPFPLYRDCSKWLEPAKKEDAQTGSASVVASPSVAEPRNLYEATWMEWLASYSNQPIRTTLIAVRDTETAEEMRRFFAKQIDPLTHNEIGQQVIVLTKKEIEKDPVRAAALYKAWMEKEPSTASNGIVPIIVIGVNLFLEGTDAKGLFNLMIARKIGASNVWQQLVGRNARSYPLKFRANTSDMFGVRENVEIRQLLLASASERLVRAHRARASLPSSHKDSHNDAVDRELPTKEQVTRQVGAPDPVLLDSEDRDELLKCIDGSDKSSALMQFFDDIPAQLAERHYGGHYVNLTAAEVDALHTCIARRMGYAVSEMLEHYLNSLASDIMRGLPLQKIQEYRTQLYPAFVRAEGIDKKRSSEVIFPRGGAARLVYGHVVAKLRHHDDGITNDHIAKLFPEFSLESRSRFENRAHNLRYIRRYVLNVSERQVAKILCDFILPKFSVTDDPTGYSLLRDFAASVLDDQVESIRLVESLDDEDAYDRHPLSGLVGKDTVASWYIQLPLLKGKLELNSFMLSPDEFGRQLVVSGILKVTSNTFWDGFGPALVKAVQDLTKPCKDNAFEKKLERLCEYLSTPGALIAGQKADWTVSRIQSFQLALSAVERVTPDQTLQQKTRELLTTWIKAVLCHSEIHFSNGVCVSKERVGKGGKSTKERADRWTLSLSASGDEKVSISLAVDLNVRRPLLRFGGEAIATLVAAVDALPITSRSQAILGLAQAISEIALFRPKTIVVLSTALKVGERADSKVHEDIYIEFIECLHRQTGLEIAGAGWFAAPRIKTFTPTLENLEISTVTDLDSTELGMWRTPQNACTGSIGFAELLGMIRWAKDGGRGDLVAVTQIAAQAPLTHEVSATDLSVVRLARRIILQEPISHKLVSTLTRLSFLVRHLQDHHGHDVRIPAIVNAFCEETSTDTQRVIGSNCKLAEAFLRLNKFYPRLVSYWRNGKRLEESQLEELFDISLEMHRSIGTLDQQFIDLSHESKVPERIDALYATIYSEETIVKRADQITILVPKYTQAFRNPESGDVEFVFGVEAFKQGGKGTRDRAVLHLSKECPSYKPVSEGRFRDASQKDLPAEPITQRDFDSHHTLVFRHFATCSQCKAGEYVK